MQWLKFDRLRWQKGRPETAEYHCEGCDAAIAEHHKTAMLEGGEWRATATAADPTTVGYHLSALYSPIGWLSWERIVRSWDAAQGSDEAIKAFRNTILGETWVETGEAPDWQRLYDRRERWTSGTVPAGGLFLTAGADVQKDRIEVDVWAWGRGLESWLVDHVVIEGGPDRHDAWSELTALLDRSWPHERGAHLRIARLAIDTGYEAPAVYSWSRAQGFAQVSPVKGVEGFNRSSPVSGPTFVDATEGGKRLRRGARLWTVAVSTFKAETYRFLRLARPTDEDMADGARVPARLGASAALGRERMAEAVRGRAAGDGAHKARLRPAGMAEAARAQRGAGLPGLCPRRRLDRGRGPLARREMARSRGSARGGPHRQRSRRADQPAGTGPAGQAPLRLARTARRMVLKMTDWTETELSALRRAYASGTTRVSYDGKSVDYGSAEDLLARIRTIERAIAGVSRPLPVAGLAGFSRGDR